MTGPSSVNGASTTGGASTDGTGGNQFGQELANAEKSQQKVQFTDPMFLIQSEAAYADLTDNHSLLSLRAEPDDEGEG